MAHTTVVSALDLDGSTQYLSARAAERLERVGVLYRINDKQFAAIGAVEVAWRPELSDGQAVMQLLPRKGRRKVG